MDGDFVTISRNHERLQPCDEVALAQDCAADGLFVSLVTSASSLRFLPVPREPPP